MAGQESGGTVGVQEGIPMSLGNVKKGNRRPNKCPSCKSEKVIRIVYGLPDADAIKKAEEGLIALGGCCVDDDNPRWKCNACKHEW